MKHIDVQWTDDDVLLAGVDSWWYPDRSVILMDRRLRQAEKRCALAHELAHIERGDEPCIDPRSDARQEVAADVMAARWLIELEPLLHALRWSECHAEVADELWVTEDLLATRLTHLHPAERAYLRKGLDDD